MKNCFVSFIIENPYASWTKLMIISITSFANAATLEQQSCLWRCWWMSLFTSLGGTCLWECQTQELLHHYQRWHWWHYNPGWKDMEIALLISATNHQRRPLGSVRTSWVGPWNSYASGSKAWKSLKNFHLSAIVGPLKIALFNINIGIRTVLVPLLMSTIKLGKS